MPDTELFDPKRREIAQRNYEQREERRRNAAPPYTHQDLAEMRANAEKLRAFQENGYTTPPANYGHDLDRQSAACGTLDEELERYGCDISQSGVEAIIRAVLATADLQDSENGVRRVIA